MKKWDARLLLAWGIPSLIMLLLYIGNGIYPFGKMAFLTGDLYHQYIPFLQSFIDKVQAGENLSYSWNVGIGSNYLAMFGYYLSSPFHLLTLMLPEQLLLEVVAVIVLVKVGLCGFSFALFLKKHFGTDSWLILFFSTFYALSGYMAAYNYNIMWLDAVWVFPLVMYGLEKLVKEGSGIVYTITLGCCIFMNFYISIMICIFLVLYFGVLFLTEKGNLKTLLRFAGFSLQAGGLAAVLLVPEVCAIITTDFGDVSFPEQIKSYFSIIDELARHAICVEPEKGLDHWPNIYCGVIVFLLVPLYGICKEIPLRRRFCHLALAGFMLISFSTNVLDFIWHGLNYPDSLPGRQAFLYIFLILLMSYEVMEHVDGMLPESIVKATLCAVAFLIVCEKFVKDDAFAVWVLPATIVVAVMYGVILYFYRTREDEDWRIPLIALLLMVGAVEAATNTGYTSVKVYGRENFWGKMDDYRTLYETVLEQEEGFSRVESFQRMTKNDSQLAGYPSASLFSSTLNSSVANLYEKLGMRHSKVYYCFDGATPFTSALLNVGYMLGDRKSMQQDDFLAEQEQGMLYQLIDATEDVNLYQCTYTLPFGYVAPVGYELVESELSNPLTLQNQMVKELGIRQELFVRVDDTNEGDTIAVTAREDGYYYSVITRSGTSKVDVQTEYGEKSYKDLKVDGIVYLGYLEADQRLELTNGNEEDTTPEMYMGIYRLNQEVMAQVVDALSAQHLEDVTYDDRHIAGTLHLESAGRLILSVPYEAGWTVLINGEEVEPQTFGECFMAFDLEAGEYELEMSYVPQGKVAGIVISLVSLVALVGIIAVSRYSEKKKKFVI
ncbi:MAG: YfhO family protein [Lachnospiraceae bacterium]|nr:YfhO family protein [Lachnospiraceae bacterium]